MKIKHIITTAVATALISSANAFIVTLESGFDKAVTTIDDAPLPFGGGFVATGFFTTIADVDLENTAPADLSTAFSVFGAPGAFGFGGLGGVYQVESAGGRIGPASAFANQSIYTVLGNGANVASSTQFVIYKHAGTFLVDNADPQDKTFTATLGSGGTYLMGEVTGSQVTIGGFDFPQVRMQQAIPEPSAALLGALGALGLLRRRRA